MKLLIQDIPKGGLDLHFSTEKEEWFRTVLRDALQEAYHTEDSGTGEAHCERTGENVDIAGQVRCICHPTCARCSNAFSLNLNVPLHILLAPLLQNIRQLDMEQKSDVELVKEDLEFTFYEGDRFDLGALIREQVILALPQQPLCQPQCKGLCQYCGADLNVASCQCKEKTEDHRWAPLKKLKVSKS